MKRILPVLLLALACMVFSGCVRRSWRYYPPDSKTLPENLKPTPSATPEPGMESLQWIPATDERFTVSGLAFFQEDGGKWQRFPDRAKSVIPEKVWRLSEMPSGGRIRFRSNTTALALRAAWPAQPSMRNMHAFGQAGIDVYINGEYKGTLAPRKDLEVEKFLFQGLQKEEHEITIYLPLYLGVDIREIGLDSEATISPPSAFAAEKPVVFYGTSITQGGCASHPGTDYQGILSRRLNVDFVNFGFSGAGRGEPEVIDFVAEVDASCYVIDMAQNNPSAEDLEEKYGPLLDNLRSKHPDTPILCTTPIYAASEFAGFEGEKILPAMRDVVRRAVEERKAQGDENIQVIEGYTLLGPTQGDGLTDGVHPNDLGFYWMANGLEPRLREVLELPEVK